ncbi:MAG: CobW family GTP-binding protein [Thermoanaerobaculia bacterium]
MLENDSRIPVHVLSGFLGVGKTTAVKDLLTRRADRERIAVIVNEFGELGIDGALLSDCASCVLKEVPGGCVCCTAMADLEGSLEEILDLVAPTRLVVEPTGLARPSQIVDLFRMPRFLERFEVRPVITLIDPQQDFRALYAQGGLYREQIDLGDILVINRCDLASEAQIVSAEEFGASLTPPRLAIVRASLGALPDAVFDMRFPSGRDLAASEAARPSLLHAHGGAEHGTEGYVGHGFGRAPDRVFDADLLEEVLSALAAGELLAGSVARAKGIFNTSTGWRVHEIAGGRASQSETAYRRDSRFDVIVKNPAAGDFPLLDARLEQCLVPEGAPILSVERDGILLRSFDARALETLPRADEDVEGGDNPRLGDLLERAGDDGESPWIWLVSEGGLFGAGGPRDVLARGFVIAEGDEFRFVLPDSATQDDTDELDTCRDIPDLCAVRLAEMPGNPDDELVPEDAE